MGWIVDHDLDGFAASAGPLLARSPVEHTVPLTLIAALQAGVSWSDVEPVFAVHTTQGGTVDAAALMTPPHPLQVSGDVDLPGLATALADVPVRAVNAREPVAHAFAAARAVGSTVELRLHLLELDTLIPARPPHDGGARAATAADAQVVTGLVTAMRAELHEHGETPAQLLRDRIAAGAMWLWLVDGDAVAVASSTKPVEGVSRIQTVFTPPEHRGHGYAAAVTAVCTQAALAAGATRMCLFTDAANPTSNGVYERLGYRRRPDDRVVLRFEA